MKRSASSSRGSSRSLGGKLPRCRAPKHGCSPSRNPIPEFDLDAGLLEQFGTETSDEEYETKIAGFLERGYEQDINADSQMTATYREAYARLAEGDHYLLVMIDRALGSTLRRRR